MGIKYFRVDFLAWYETGYDRGVGTVGPARTRAQYDSALHWMREACDENGVFLSLVMPNLTNNGEIEKKYGHMIRVNSDAASGEWWFWSEKDRGTHFTTWSQYSNAMDGLAYWSILSGRDSVILDPDFLRINTFANNNEKKSVVSACLMAGAPVTIADQFNTIGNNIWVYQNEELLALNTDKFVGKPFSSDPTNDNSQVWKGQLSNGDWVIGLFNREASTKIRTIQFAQATPVRDMWQHEDLGAMSSYTATIPPHGCVILKVKAEPVNPTALPQLYARGSFAAWDTRFEMIPDAAGVFTARSVYITAGSQEMKFANGDFSNNYSNGSGLSGSVVHDASASNTKFTAPSTGFYDIVFNINTLTYSIALSPYTASNMLMFASGSFNGFGTVDRMVLTGNNTWRTLTPIALSAKYYEMKFRNDPNWAGKDWGKASGLSGTASEATGGGANLNFTTPADGDYTIIFNDQTLEYSIVSYTALPYKKLFFQGSIQSGKALLLWQTTGEENSKAFDIERSSNGKDFNVIGSLAANNTSEENSYSFTDVTPSTGTIYYRLKLIDKDGSVVYSTIIEVLNSKTSKLSLYPNPANKSITVTHEKANQNAVIIISTVDGKAVQFYPVERNGVTTSADISKLQAGFYSVLFQNGNEKLSTTFIKD